MPEYSDGHGLLLLEELAVYAEAFKTDHTDPELTVKELADDLCTTMDSMYDQQHAQRLRDRIYDGLNNVTFDEEPGNGHGNEHDAAGR